MAADPNYDPQKAHEAYLRRRKLKGRQPGVRPISTSGNRTSAKPAPQPKTAKQLREETEARVVKLKAKLKRLRALLAELVKQAKARSGVKTEPDKTEEASSDKKDSKDLSVQEKAKAAKRSKENYEKNKKDEDPSKQEESLKEDMEEVRAKIQKIRDELKDSIQNARTKATPPV